MRLQNNEENKGIGCTAGPRYPYTTLPYMLGMMLVQHGNVKWIYYLFVIWIPCIKNLCSDSLGKDNLSLILQLPTIQWLFYHCSFCLALYLLSQNLFTYKLPVLRFDGIIDKLSIILGEADEWVRSYSLRCIHSTQICILNGPDYLAKNWFAFLIDFNIHTHAKQTDMCHVKDLNNNWLHSQLHEVFASLGLVK